VLPGQSQQVFGVADGSGDGVGLSLTMGVLVGSSARAGVWAESAAIGSNTARVSVIAATARGPMLRISHTLLRHCVRAQVHQHLPPRMKGLMAEVEPLLVAALAEEFGAVVWAVVDEVVAAIQVLVVREDEALLCSGAEVALHPRQLV